MRTVFRFRTLLAFALCAGAVTARGQNNYATPYTFTTWAGNAGYGSTNGTGSTARFYLPDGVAVDAAGNIYVADWGFATIRKITSAGVVTTLAGSPGLYGSADGSGGSARFLAPSGIAVDGAGNVYVADSANATVRKITSAGVVTTLAGLAGVTGSTDGTGIAARFNDPEGLAVDGAGNVYVADYGNGRIRKVTSAGVVTTLATSGSVLAKPVGLAVDGTGNLYVADASSATIAKIASSGTVTIFAGTVGSTGSTDGQGSSARFTIPFGLTLDNAGNLYVTELRAATIRKITTGGLVTTLAGSAEKYGSADGVADAARFDSPQGIGADSSGNLYVADSSNNTIRKITNGTVTTFAGSFARAGTANGPGELARFNSPGGVAVAGDTVIVADTNNATIRRITSAGNVSTVAGVPGFFGSADGIGGNARFANPSGIVTDAAGNIYVTDTGNNTVRKITSGTVTTVAGLAGSPGTVDGIGFSVRLNNPTGITLDSAGNIYVTEPATIRKITSGGLVTTLAGTAGITGAADGVGGSARFNHPGGIAADRSGNLYVSDTLNHTIRKITSDGAVTTLAGKAGSSGSIDGTGSGARFDSPRNLVADADGNLYVVDDNTALIRKITSEGVVTTLAGAADRMGAEDGTGADALFRFPLGIAIDNAGVLYVADTGNNTIRRGVAALVPGNDARLSAISCRAVVGTGSDVLIPGLIVGGSGKRQVIVRASGPAIQGVSGTLARPKLSLYQVGIQAQIASNTGWSSGTASETSALQAAFTAAGLPPYPVGSADCALLATLDAGAAYTAVVSGENDSTGVALIEVYELGTSSARLTAISCRAQVGTGENILIPGIAITGTTPKQVIIRAAGPALAAQGVPGTLAQLRLQLYSGGTKLAENIGWSTASNAAEIFTVTPTCGLTNFPANSADCVILTTLAPGGYTAQVSGLNDTTGVALIEVYEVP